MSWQLTLQELVQATSGSALSSKASSFSGVSTNSRVDNSGKIFFALKGEKYDAHDFLTQALQQKAAAVVIHKKTNLGFDLENAPVTVVVVKDTLRALQDLSHYWRKKLKTKIVALTGSNGKTTTKEFIARLISEKYKTQYSQGSYNNHFGVPLSLLSVDSTHKCAVIEMGMNHSGEITELCKIAEPDIVLVTMVGRAHIEFFGSIENIAKAKEEIYLASPSNAIRIYNIDSPHTKAMYDRAPKECTKLVCSSQNSNADVFLKEVVSTLDYTEVTGKIGDEPGKVKVPIFGRQNIYNLMAAACAALAAGVEADTIWQALPKCKTSWGRNQMVKLTSGAKLVFDGYNANPDSVTALIENFSRLNVSGKKIAILGEMLELGELSAQLHNEIGQTVARAGFDIVWFTGPHAKDFEAGIRAGGFSKKLLISDTYQEVLASQITSVLQPSDIVLVKGSRGMKLEKAVHALSPVDFDS